MNKPLRFPPFHSSILQQSHWDASDGLGRIKIVISEGVSHPQDGLNTLGGGYHKLRDIVAFSFQHAPRNVLEYSGIAWPNARMFSKTAQSTPKANFDAHAHSPQRPLDVFNQRKSMPMSLHAVGPQSGKQVLSTEDPFVEQPKDVRRQTRPKTMSDVSISDRPIGRNQSEMSGVSFTQADFLQQVNRAAVDEIIQALTPTKRAALLNALSPAGGPNSMGSTAAPSTSTSVPSNRSMSTKLFSPALQAHMAANRTRHSSSESRRSTSGHSAVMSWDDTPTLSSLWSNTSNGYNSLLPTLQSSANSKRSASIGPKRKRSLSLSEILHSGNNTFIDNTKGMSTSPPKQSPTPKQNSAFVARQNKGPNNNDCADSKLQE